MAQQKLIIKPIPQEALPSIVKYPIVHNAIQIKVAMPVRNDQQRPLPAISKKTFTTAISNGRKMSNNPQKKIIFSIVLIEVRKFPFSIPK